VAAGLSIDRQMSFRQLSSSSLVIGELQQELIRRGAHLEEFESPRIADMDHWAYDGLAVMRELGLASGGYTNQYNLEITAEYWDIQRILTRVEARIRQLQPEAALDTVRFDNTPLTRRDMLNKAVRMLQLEEDADPADPLRRAGILTEEVIQRMEPMDQKPTFGELYWLGARLFAHSMSQ